MSKFNFALRWMLIIISILLTYQKLQSQTLYKTEFKGIDGTIYKGLLVYYNEEKAFMRIRYKSGNSYEIINTKYKSKTGVTQKNKKNYLLLIGSEPYSVTKRSDASSYYKPDYFIFLWDKDTYNSNSDLKIYVTDDKELNRENWIECNYFKEVSTEELTEEFLKKFFRTDEQIYYTLLKLNKENYQQEYSYNNSYNNQNYTTSKPTFHLIIVANTAIPDIGKSCSIDLNAMKNEFNGIASFLNVKINNYIIEGQDFNKNKLLRVLDNLTVNPNDVIIFYYTGHGFRWADQTDKYPSLDMRSSEYMQMSMENAIYLNQIINKIEKKGARMNLILSDCCNVSNGRNGVTSSSYIAGRSFQGADKAKLEKLFFRSNGTIISSACAPGEVAWCNPSVGGFFTVSFFQALKEEVGLLNDKQPSWENIMENTRKNTRNKSQDCYQCKTQNPIYTIK